MLLSTALWEQNVISKLSDICSVPLRHVAPPLEHVITDELKDELKLKSIQD
jgi:hypothetical protein